MPCLQCDAVKDIPTCTTNLVIGTTGLGNGVAVYIFIKNVTTGKEYRQLATTSNVPPGRVTLVMANPRQDFYSPNFTYEIWITLIGDTINERQNFTVQGSALEFDCVNVNFVNIVVNDDSNVDYGSHILEFDA